MRNPPLNKRHFKDHLVPDLAMSDKSVFPRAIPVIRDDRKVSVGGHQCEQFRDYPVDIANGVDLSLPKNRQQFRMIQWNLHGAILCRGPHLRSETVQAMT